jgi:hypothetical protein
MKMLLQSIHDIEQANPDNDLNDGGATGDEAKGGGAKGDGGSSPPKATRERRDRQASATRSALVRCDSAVQVRLAFILLFIYSV